MRGVCGIFEQSCVFALRLSVSAQLAAGCSLQCGVWRCSLSQQSSNVLYTNAIEGCMRCCANTGATAGLVSKLDLLLVCYRPLANPGLDCYMAARRVAIA